MRIDDLEKTAYPPVDKFTDIRSILDPMGWYQDNPGGKWLAEKQEMAARGYTGSTTALLGRNRPCLIYLKHAIKFDGAVGEQAWRNNDERYHHMMKHFDPSLVDEVMIWVLYDGRCLIGEGNHRVQVCHDQGLSWIPADIRYFCGGEQVPGVLYPRTAIDGVVKPGNQLF